MKILGIDPGSSRCGYGLIEKTSSQLTLLDCGCINIKESDINQKLLYLSQDIRKIIESIQPDVLAIEKLYFVKNIKTGIEVAQARGVIILHALQNKISISEHNPQEIKLSVTGYGLSDKKAVAKMVKILLNQPNLKVIDDTTDALAVAITASQSLNLKSLIKI